MFDYFHASEQEQYLFLQMPLMLIKDEQFKGLSDGAKILYSLLLSRTSLSAKNGWTDEEGRVYIIYTIDEITKDLNCWEQKATKAMKELREIGLVNSVRRGLGKPNILYVMNFATALKYRTKNASKPEKPVNPLNCENHNSRIAEITIQELPESQFKNGENHNVVISVFNNIDQSYIDSNQIKSNRFVKTDTEKDTEDKTDKMGEDEIVKQTAESEKEQKKESYRNAPTDQSMKALTKPSKPKYRLDEVTEIVKENIYYDYIIEDKTATREMLDEIVYVIASTICAEYKDGYISMGEERVHAESVKSVFLKLGKEDIEYFVECFDRQTAPVTKLTPYIRASLFRNYGTIDHYWKNRVHVDMPYMAGKKIQSKQE